MLGVTNGLVRAGACRCCVTPKSRFVSKIVGALDLSDYLARTCSGKKVITSHNADGEDVGIVMIVGSA